MNSAGLFSNWGDYMAAGLYDRAEDMFNQLYRRNGIPRRRVAVVLLQIHQLTSDWQKAIEVAERLVKLGKR